MNVLDLRTLPVYYINMEEAAQRNIELKNVLKEFGFKKSTRVEGPKKQHPWHGCASGHLAAMRNRKPPFIVLEDDCRIKTKNNLIDIPEDADCVYLGICDRALVGAVKFFPHSRDLVKLHDMLSAHAILFLSEDYHRECIKMAQECVSHGSKALDISYAKNMARWNVYALVEPIFYQEKCVLKTNIRFKTDCPYIDDSGVP